MDMRIKSVTAALLAAGLLLCSGARAEDAGQDEVTLKNGGSIRGTVVSSEPGTSVKIIEMGQTQARVIPWSQVADVERGKYAPSAPAQPGPAGPGYGAAPAPAPETLPPPEVQMGARGVVRLHVESPQPATVVEQRSAVVGGYGAYGSYGVVVTAQRPVCSSPCDTVVDSRGRIFTLANDRYPAPRSFSFDGMTGDVTLRVEPGSNGQRVGGVLAIVLGSIAAVTGAIMIPVALGTTTTDLTTGVDVDTPDKGLRNAGAGMLVGGLVALGGGIALLATGSTKVHIEPRGAASSAQRRPRYWMGEF